MTAPAQAVVVAPARPRTRGECVNGPRPCPWRACRFHLGDHGRESCALDVAARGGITLAEVGDVIGVTREWVRQIEVGAIRKLRENGLLEFLSSDGDAEEPSSEE